MTSMVEKVAKAIWEERRRNAAIEYPECVLEEWEDASAPLRSNIMGEARAAIEAMREPTVGMKAAIREQLSLPSRFPAHHRLDLPAHDRRCLIRGWRSGKPETGQAGLTLERAPKQAYPR